MIAIGDYVLINIPPTVISGIHVKNDGYGVCISAPSLPHIEGRRVMFDSDQKYHEYEDNVIIHKNHLLLCLEEE